MLIIVESPAKAKTIAKMLIHRFRPLLVVTGKICLSICYDSICPSPTCVTDVLTTDLLDWLFEALFCATNETLTLLRGCRQECVRFNYNHTIILN